jgi:hypothetical protein
MEWVDDSEYAGMLVGLAPGFWYEVTEQDGQWRFAWDTVPSSGDMKVVRPRAVTRAEAAAAAEVHWRHHRAGLTLDRRRDLPLA